MKKKGLMVLGGLVLSLSLLQPVTSYAEDTTEETSVEAEVVDTTQSSEDVEVVQIQVEYGDGIQCIDGIWVYVKNGEIVSQLKAGWNQINAGWYYLKEGNLVINDRVKVGGYWYGFDSTGRMISDTTYGQYRYDEQGHMVTGWYIISTPFEHGSYSTEAYYYHEDGRAADGLTEIDGVTYYFFDGRMNTVSLQSGRDYYVIANNGVVKNHIILEDGWNIIEGNKCYVVDGVIQKNQWLEVDGSKYYAGVNGFVFTTTPAGAIDGYFYAFDEEGRMLTGWQKGGDSWYYFDEDGKSITDYNTRYVVKTIDGKQYYFFAYGKLLNVPALEIDGKLYKSDVDGSLIPYSSKTSGWANEYFYMQDGKAVTGWKKIDGSYYYFTENGKVIGNMQIDGNQYYFDQFGKMKTGWYSFGGIWYWADSSGKVVQNGWKKINNAWYYFEGTLYATGMKKIDGEWNLFDTNGKWVRAVNEKNKWISNSGKYYYVDSKGTVLTNSLMEYNGKTYYLGYTGEMATNSVVWIDSNKTCYFDASGAMVKNKWMESDDYMSKWYYYGSDGARVRGWQKISGKWYYFDEFGMVTGDIKDGDIVYHFNDNGVWDGKSDKKASGWYKINGEYYYDGPAIDLGGGWKQIGSKMYYFGYGRNGLLATNNVVGKAKDQYYYLDSNGEVFKNGWCKLVGGSEGPLWYYANKDGVLAIGLQTIGGKQYYFGPNMMTQDTVSNDSKTLYQISSSGEVTKVINAAGTKWVKTANGNWFYSKNGKYVKGYEVIDGKGYYFNTEGAMVKNQIITSYGYFGSNGELSKKEGWVSVNGDWYYLHGTVNLMAGFGSVFQVGISGKTYLVRFRLNTFTSGFYREGDTYYYYDLAKETKTAYTFKEGWNKYNNEWYYYSNGALANGLTRIGGKWYYFYDCKMISDRMVYIDWNEINQHIYLGADGVMVKNTWKKIDGTWFYFDANGYALVGEHYIDGVKYNFPKLYY